MPWCLWLNAFHENLLLFVLVQRVVRAAALASFLALSVSVRSVSSPATTPQLLHATPIRQSLTLKLRNPPFSIIMTTRHDSTAYCHNEHDHCLDRLRAALSTRLHFLHEHGLGHDSEILLVEWNPCRTAASKAPHCDRSERGGRGFLSLAEAVEGLVVPPLSPTPVRVLTVSEVLHEHAMYNPTRKDIMEFIGKNVAARRAVGEFLLFTNPDNIFSQGLGRFIAQRRMRHDTCYTTMKAHIYLDVPLGSLVSPASMLNFAHRTYTREQYQLDAAHKGFRRAACPLAGGEDARDDDDEPFVASGSDDLSMLFSTATGDFFLAARDIVRAVRAYAECPVNVHVDSLMVAAVAAHGFGSLVLCTRDMLHMCPVFI